MNCHYCPKPITGGAKLIGSDTIVGVCNGCHGLLLARGEIMCRLDRVRRALEQTKAEADELARQVRVLWAQEDACLKELRAMPMHERRTP